MLLDICDIVFAPSVSVGHITYLADLVRIHHELFKTLFPEHNLRYKHHRMVHYPSIILRNGPMLSMWVIRYEAKHNYFKRLAHIVCNFQNICKTLSMRNQISQCFSWWKGPPFKVSVEVGNGNITLLQLLPDFKNSIPEVENFTEVFVANWVKICGTKYTPGLTVIVSINPENEPTFGYIDKIVVVDGTDVYFGLRRWAVSTFNEKQHSYSCRLSVDYFTVRQADLLDFHPLYGHQCLEEQCSYFHITLHHILCSDQ